MNLVWAGWTWTARFQELQQEAPRLHPLLRSVRWRAMTRSTQDDRLIVCLVRLDQDGPYFHRLRGAWCYHSKSVVCARPLPARATWFISRAVGSCCEIEWVAETLPSPFPSGAARLVLGAGQVLDVPDRTYLVYVDVFDSDDDDPTGPEPESMAVLSKLVGDERELVTARFLSLPTIAPVLCEQFVAQTGFEQCRDGRIPAVRRCFLQMNDSPVIQCEIAVWHLFRRQWTDSRSALLERRLGGRDFDRLAKCATIYARLPTIKPDPWVHD